MPPSLSWGSTPAVACLRRQLSAPRQTCWPASCRPRQPGRRSLVKAAKRAARRPSTAGSDTTDTAADARLPPLALAPLRDVALLCGRNSSGTKAALRADLAAVLEEDADATTDTTPRRILSIDMGVRNLAFCVLAVCEGHAIPRLVAWERISLLGDREQSPEDSTPATPPSAFAPPAMAAAAARLVCDRLLPLAPTHVLIERQRFRSGGAAAVLEWTVRVNSLEAMLHGVFAYRLLTRTGSTEPVQSVHAVSPQRVAQFLTRGGLAPNSGAPWAASLSAHKDKDSKDVRQAFVAHALRAGLLLTPDSDVRGLADAYLQRWDTKQSRSGSRPGTRSRSASASAASKPPLVLSKIDDLADCLAQGLVWLEWERNKILLRTRGATTLLADKPLPS